MVNHHLDKRQNVVYFIRQLLETYESTRNLGKEGLSIGKTRK